MRTAQNYAMKTSHVECAVHRQWPVLRLPQDTHVAAGHAIDDERTLTAKERATCDIATD